MLQESSLITVLIYIKNKKPAADATSSKKQRQKDLNPRHLVLETNVLPTELYLYKQNSQ